MAIPSERVHLRQIKMIEAHLNEHGEIFKS